MPRDTRTYITLHDGMPEHPKVEPLTDRAFRDLVSLWCWCSRNRTDGKVPTAVWMKRAGAKIRAELIAAGLVEETAEGALMHDYLEHQRSAAEIDELSAKRRDAGSKGGSKAQAKKRASARASAQANVKPAPSKTQADTETEVPTTSGGEPPAAETPGQRGNRLAKAYTDLVPLSNFPAVAGVVRKAMGAGYDDEAIVGGLRRLANENRSVTTDTLRVELEGLPVSRYNRQDEPRAESPEERRVREARQRQREAS